MAYTAGTAGSFTVQNPSGLPLTISATRASGTAATLYSDAARSASLGTSTTQAAAVSSFRYYLNDTDTYTISVTSNGRQIANTPDGTRTYVASSDTQLVFAVDPDISAIAGSPFVVGASMSVDSAGTDIPVLTTQVQQDVPVYIEAGTTVTSLTVITGATASGTPTNWYVALYDPTGLTLLGQSADQLTAAMAANTVLTVALAAPVLIGSSGYYRAAIMVKATTPCSLRGANLGNVGVAAARNGLPVQAETSGSGLTGTAPATIATPTTVVGKFYVAIA